MSQKILTFINVDINSFKEEEKDPKKKYQSIKVYFILLSSFVEINVQNLYI